MKVQRKQRTFVLEDRSGATFTVGQKIPQSGIYRVQHAGHRQSHEVTLLAGEEFPRCAGCVTEVTFSLQQSAPALDSEPGFRVRLYELPHPQDSEDTHLSARTA
ncbi:hypothetical protein Acid345_2482 [Candidatus Koribacter versatilis Ellin345]|uniref:Uncharacterized protein n=1 Tax=Koribacter versatilis (strain Ellin345) TaxID=204669 RepID=Q1INR7_KORVE|nr:hypothetical protein [Candidatus Koribacter versatilis]ABF41483.1 hypothetical protein Acid345_2482 [Candidatus Koribacter versatilis Ellin345]